MATVRVQIDETLARLRALASDMRYDTTDFALFLAVVTFLVCAFRIAWVLTHHKGDMIGRHVHRSTSMGCEQDAR